MGDELKCFCETLGDPHTVCEPCHTNLQAENARLRGLCERAVHLISPRSYAGSELLKQLKQAKGGDE